MLGTTILRTLMLAAVSFASATGLDNRTSQQVHRSNQNYDARHIRAQSGIGYYRSKPHGSNAQTRRDAAKRKGIARNKRHHA